MPTVAAVYTAQALVTPLGVVFAEEIPEWRVIDIVDGGLIRDIIRDGGVTVGTARRLMHCYSAAVDAGADVILNTCSSVGDVVEHARWFIPIPILRIDGPMARKAVSEGSRIGVLATLPTTLAPTVRLIESSASEVSLSVEIIEGLAEGAFDALTGGRPEDHDRILMEKAVETASRADVLVLAQGSMARMERAIADRTGLPVFSSPRSGVAAVRGILEQPTTFRRTGGTGGEERDGA